MKNKVSIEGLTTENSNELSKNIDTMSSFDIVSVINNEDQKVAVAVAKEKENMAKAIDLMSERYIKGGRIVYVGAGTSGRLGVLDAVELIPTYSVSVDRAIGIIAGGDNAFVKAVEGAEDSKELGKYDLVKINLTKDDIVIGIAASGRTPYTIAALEYANEIGALTISVTCNPDSKMSEVANVSIAAIVGPEVVSGSTRMKAGTAQKMILNTLSTGTMIKVGYVYQNYMVYVKPTNEKLVERARQMLAKILDVDYDESSRLLVDAKMSVATAIVMHQTNCSYDTANETLDKVHGKVREAILNINK